MNNRKIVARRLEEEIAHVGVPPRDYHIHPLKEEANDDQAPIDPSSLTDGSIRAALFQNGSSYYYLSTSIHFSSSSHDGPR